MRSPHETPPAPTRRPRSGRRGWIWLVVVVVVVILVWKFGQKLATVYTDYLWFGSIHQSGVWRVLAATKVGLFLAFAAAFFVVLWLNLAVVDRLAPRGVLFGPEDEVVRRYQQLVSPRAILVRSVVSLVIALLAAGSTISQWQNWLLFTHGVPFGVEDAEFHKDVGWFVFKLPFYAFLANWVLASLVVITIVTAISHYLNGGIRVQGSRPRVAPHVKAHLSVLLALIALGKAAGYYLQRFELDFSTQGYVQGAGYTDVHARLPGKNLLFWISLGAAAILLYNIRRQGWLLPAIAVGLWAFVAVVVGAVYPALLQAIKVSPTQSTLEQPYIQRNIDATLAAYGLESCKHNGGPGPGAPSCVQVRSFAANQSLNSADVSAASQSLDDIRLWDPGTSQDQLAYPTYVKLQSHYAYYTFNTLAVDRYMLNGKETPVVIGVRQINANGIPNATWVNTHLEYTHGYGMIISPANASVENQPTFALSGVQPPVSQDGLPQLTQPNVYFGVNNPGWVMVDTKQQELPAQSLSSSGGHYSGGGGVGLGSFFTRLAFALRFGDYRILLSNEITSQSRIIFVRDIQTAINRSAPFLSLDSDPYPVFADGQIWWVQDAYTTTNYYPYSQGADTSAVSPNSGLPGNFNYISNSVKVVVNAYTGKMSFYAWDNHDPILRTWERVFPNLFTPRSKMPKQLLAHIRYPEDLFAVQSSMYGRYHLENAAQFYNSSNGWSVAQSPGAGSPTQALSGTPTINSAGQYVPGTPPRMSPIYQELQLPGQSKVSFNLMEAFVPRTSAESQIQSLTAFMAANSDPNNDYGRLTVYETPRDDTVDGPSLIDADIQANQDLSEAISLLNRGGSSVVLTNLFLVPVKQSILYFRALYVESSRFPVPKLDFVIAVYGGGGTSGSSQVAYGDSVAAALTGLHLSGFTPPSQQQPPPTKPSGSVSAQVQGLILKEAQLRQAIEADFASANLGKLQSDVDKLLKVVQQLDNLLPQKSSSQGSGSSSSTTSTTIASSPTPSTSSTTTTRSTTSTTTGSA